MSYASVAAHDAPPPSQQPQPDPSLWTTGQGSAPTVLNDTGPKVNVVDPTFKSKPKTDTSVNRPLPDSGYEEHSDFKERVRRDFHRAEEEEMHIWDVLKEHLLRPGVLGGLLGIVNIGLVSTLGYQFYTQPHLRSDRRAIAWTTAGALAFVGGESWVAEAYRKTAAGREEERRAREEGAAVYKHTKEIILRPKVFGGLMGIFNLGVIGTVSYLAYENWDRPHWDRRTISAISVGLLSLVLGEGYVAEKYHQDQYHKRR